LEESLENCDNVSYTNLFDNSDTINNLKIEENDRITNDSNLFEFQNPMKKNCQKNEKNSKKIIQTPITRTPITPIPLARVFVPPPTESPIPQTPTPQVRGLSDASECTPLSDVSERTPLSDVSKRTLLSDVLDRCTPLFNSPLEYDKNIENNRCHVNQQSIVKNQQLIVNMDDFESFQFDEDKENSVSLSKVEVKVCVCVCMQMCVYIDIYIYKYT
jgi:hypothetical protein